MSGRFVALVGTLQLRFFELQQEAGEREITADGERVGKGDKGRVAPTKV